MNSETISKIAEERMRALKSFIPTLGAAAYAITDSEGMICSGMYSFTEQEQKGDLFCIGSVSKTFTAAAVLMLCERGLLALDEPVVRYLPELYSRDGKTAGITVRMLLDHSSGLPGGSYVGMNSAVPDEDFCAKTVFLFNSKQKLACEPGEYSVYRNDGFSLAQLLVERVSGESFSDFLRKNIFEKLGMDSSFTAANVPEERMVRAFSEDGKMLPPEYVNALGAGGIYMSAEDAAVFGASLASGKLISKKSLTEMCRHYSYLHSHPSEEKLTYDFGLGLDMTDSSPMLPSEQAMFKAGGTIYYNASFSVFPESGLAAVVLSCCPEKGNGLLLKMISDNITAEVLKEKRGAELPPPIEHCFSGISEMPKELTSFSGSYSTTFNQVDISVNPDGVLNITPLDKGIPVTEAAAEYTYRADGWFANGGSGIRFIHSDMGDYFVESMDVALPLEGRASLSGLSYLGAQRVPESDCDASAWQSRAGVWGAVNIPENNLSGRPDVRPVLIKLSLPERFPGYLLFDGQLLETVSEDTADFWLKLPDMNGSDLSCVHLRSDGLLEYGGMLMQHEKSFSILADGEYTIPQDGKNLWFTVPDSCRIAVQGDGRAVLFDSQLQRTADSLTQGMPICAGGSYLQLSGKPGSKLIILLLK